MKGALVNRRRRQSMLILLLAVGIFLPATVKNDCCISGVKGSQAGNKRSQAGKKRPIGGQATSQVSPLPNFVGHPLEEAKQDTSMQVFQVKVETENDYESSWNPGIVSRQFPPAGTLMRSGMTLKLWVTAKHVFKMPDLRRKHIETVRQDSYVLHLQLGIVTEDDNSSDRQPGEVTRQSPLPGELVRIGEQVKLWVAIDAVTVPDVANRTVEEAERLLRSVRLRVGSVKQIRSNQRAGIVLRQDPQSGERVALGTSVRLRVSAPERPVTPTPADPAPPPRSPPRTDDGWTWVIQWVIGALAVVGAGYLTLSLGRRMVRSAETASPQVTIRYAIGRPDHRVVTEDRLTADCELCLRMTADPGVQRLEAAAGLVKE
jgi:beta-lactam-binding protein with PASTA domain